MSRLWRLFGSKPNGRRHGAGSSVTTSVRTSGEGHEGISLLVIERGTPGFSVGRKLEKTGWWASDTAELHFEDCAVPAANLIGEEGRGFHQLADGLQRERLLAAVLSVSASQQALEDCRDYLARRRAFDHRIEGWVILPHFRQRRYDPAAGGTPVCVQGLTITAL